MSDQTPDQGPADTTPTPVPPPAPTPPGAAPVPPPTTSNQAIIGLILAILAWILCPVIAAIPALIVARSSDKEIAASNGRLTGSGLNTATRVIAWINIGASILAGVVIAILAVLGLGLFANVAATLDPAINSQTGLADGQYSMSPSRRVNLNEECSYGGVVSMPGNSNVGDVTVYGRGPVECPYLGTVDVVLFEVVGGTARILSVQ